MAWPQHEDTSNCHEEEAAFIYETTHTLATGEQRMAWPLPILQAGADARTANLRWVELCGPQSGCPPSCVAFGWVQATDCGCFAQSFSYVWLSAKGEDGPCSQTCGLPARPRTSPRRAMHILSQKHQDAHPNCASSSGFRRCFTKNQRQVIRFLD